uniref:Uncharacterized protein n=1 Tax=Gopherus agassizii TaxID=38772 RepID=A0A452IRM9_9SAUR
FSEPAQVIPYSGQEYQELKQQCLQERCLFTDPLFDAVPRSYAIVKGTPVPT